MMSSRAKKLCLSPSGSRTSEATAANGTFDLIHVGHLRSLEQYPFDSVLLPYNFPMSRNAEYMADFEELMTVCAERNVAVLWIDPKAIASLAPLPLGCGQATKLPVEDGQEIFTIGAPMRGWRRRSACRCKAG